MAFEPVKQTNKLLELQFAEPHLYHRYALTIVNDYLKSENMTTDFNILNKYISKHVLCVEGIVNLLWSNLGSKRPLTFLTLPL